MAHLYYYGGTVDGLTITKEQLETAVSCMYEKSGSFAKVIQKIFRSKADTQIAIIVGEGTDEFSEVLHPDNYARYAAEHGLSPTWPYVGVDVVIIVDPRRLDGDYFPSGALNTLERALGHEFDHVPDVLKNGYGNEEKTTDAEDRIAFELYPDGPEQGRDEYANLPINVPSIGVQTTSTCDTDPITHTLPPRENNLDRPEQIRDLKGTAETNGSPLVLDLDDSGTIDLVSLGNSSIYWDIDEDGFRELTGWVQAVDGLLAYDLNENGIIDNNAELFGSVSTDGFAILALHDSNEDGHITAEDSIWTQLRVWKDENQNGFSEHSELYSLDTYNIVSFDLAASEVSNVNEGHTVSHISTYTVDDGVNPPDTVIVHDVWFQYDNMYTVFDQEYDIDHNAFMIGADKRGYGNIPDLFIAMSLDNDTGDTGSLVSLVTELAELDLSDIFTSDLTASNLITEIMYRWAEADAIDPDSRGGNIDARQLVFLEKYTGEEFVQTGSVGQRNPFPNAAGDLKEGFWLAQQDVFAKLISQFAGKELYQGHVRYDLETDSVLGFEGLETGTIDTLETLATALSNTYEREIFWSNVVRVIEHTIGVDNLDGGDAAYLDAAITGSDGSLDLADIMNLIAYDAPTSSTHNGTSGNDTISAGSGDDEINGLAGDDTLEGEEDGDYLLGGSGNDTYVYNVGDGDDAIRETSTGTGNDNDRILFGPGIDIGDLTFTRSGEKGLIIDIDTGSYEAQIVIENQFNYAGGGGHVEWLEFDDTSTYDLDGQSWTTYGTAGADDIRGVRDGAGGLGNDTIYGLGGNDWIRVNAPNESDYLANTVYGGDGDDSIHGDGGADTLYGDAGNDYIEGGSGNDTLSGGAGDDELIGELGNDTFIYSAGHDYINDNSGTDVINLDAAWNGVTPLYLRTNNTLTVWFDANNTITINNHYSGNAVESMVYANSTTVNLTTVSAVSQGDDSANTLNGTTGVDTIYGNGGNDTIDAKGGNDTVYGGSGDDYIEGGNGNDYLDGGPGSDSIEGGGDNDTYYFSSGHDWFNDTSGTDTLVFANGWTIEQMTFNRYVADIDDMVIEINGSNSVTIEGQFGNSKKLETFTYQAGSVSSATIVVTAHGTSGNDTISGFTYGGSTNDIVYGYDGADTLTGGDGNDTLYGGNGNDTLVGSNDNDVLYGGAGDDYMGGASSGNGGNDTFVYESGLDTVTDYLGSSSSDTLWISGGRTINDIAGFANSGSNDTLLTITASVDEILVKYLRGGSQHHVEWVTFDDGFITSLPDYAGWLSGSSGNDLAAGNSSDNTIIGFAGDDTITGAGGNDDAHGGAGEDSLDGGDGNDLLYGGDDDDILYGKAGLDTMHGGDGADTFVFETASAFSDIDVIRDFSVTDADVLDLTDILDTVYDPMTDAIADFVEFTESSGSTFVSVDRDGTGGTYSMAQIIKLENVIGLASPESLELNGNLLAA